MKNVSQGTVVHMRDFRASEVGKQVGEALSSVTQALSSMSESFFDEWEALAKRAHQAARTTDELVQENPWAAAGVAAVVGVATGFFVARAARRPQPTHVDDRGLNDG